MKQKVAEWLLLAAVSALTVLVMFAQMPMLRSVAVVLAALGLVAVALMTKTTKPARQAAWPDRALIIAMFLWTAWSVASLGWSVFPEASAAAWLDEVAAPLIGFLGFYRLGSIGRMPKADASPLQSTRRTPDDAEADRPRYACCLETVAWLATLLLALLGWAEGRFISAAQLSFWLAFYPKGSDAALLALIVLPFFIAMAGRARTRLAGVSGIALALLAGVAAADPFFVPCAVLVLIVAMWPLWRERRLLAALAVPVLVAAGIAAWVGFGSMPMLKIASANSMDRAHLASPATLPSIWTFYGEKIVQHPLLGVGFGKPLPAVAYAETWPASSVPTEAPAAHAVLTADPRTQAHNLFLNTILQLGIPGLLIECLMLLTLIRAFVVSVPGDRWLRAAGVALVVGVIAKNMTDDALWQGPMLAFWAYAGWLLGRAKWSAMINHRASSGRAVAMRRLRRVGN